MLHCSSLPSFRSASARLAAGLADLLLPPLCGGCGAWLGDPLCARCRQAFEPDLEDARIPRLSACVAAVAYAGSVVDWVHRFKYPAPGVSVRDGTPIAVMRDLVVDAAHLVPPRLAPDLVAAVPMHRRRLRERGFDPAAILARQAAREMRALEASSTLRRRRDTPSQTGLDRNARRRNVSGAFLCRRQMPGCVWLVDDVVTTGATLSECARVLRRAGAKRVVAVCAARTPRPDADEQP